MGSDSHKFALNLRGCQRALATFASQRWSKRPRISPRPERRRRRLHTTATAMTATMHLQHRWRRRAARRTASADAATVARRLGLGRSNGASKKATKCSRTTMTCRAAQLIWPLPATSTRRFSPPAAPWPARLTHGAWRCGPGSRADPARFASPHKSRSAMRCSAASRPQLAGTEVGDGREDWCNWYALRRARGRPQKRCDKLKRY